MEGMKPINSWVSYVYNIAYTLVDRIICLLSWIQMANKEGLNVNEAWKFRHNMASFNGISKYLALTVLLGVVST